MKCALTSKYKIQIVFVQLVIFLCKFQLANFQLNGMVFGKWLIVDLILLLIEPLGASKISTLLL